MFLVRKSFPTKPSKMSSTSSFNFRRSGFDVLKFGVAVFGGYLGLMSVQPTPTAYVKGNVSGGILDKNPPGDPKAELMFGNVGLGPMFLNEVKILSNGKEVDSIEDAVDRKSDKKYEFTTESTAIYQLRGIPRAWDRGGLIPLCTVRPAAGQDLNSKEFLDQFVKDLRDNHVEMEVTFSASDSSHWFLAMLTHGKRRFPVL